MSVDERVRFQVDGVFSGVGVWNEVMVAISETWI